MDDMSFNMKLYQGPHVMADFIGPIQQSLNKYLFLSLSLSLSLSMFGPN